MCTYGGAMTATWGGARLAGAAAGFRFWPMSPACPEFRRLAAATPVPIPDPIRLLKGPAVGWGSGPTLNSPTC